ncbi:MAG TPA: hypothetical protein VHJ20_22325 [Polyangia bacterium]|nr:hypothetical protein [Polyangia bacterium]
MTGAFFASSVARAADDPSPLVVVVETGAGAAVDAAAVRAAIAAELHRRVVAPAATSAAIAGPREDALLVTIDREHIVASFRGGADRALTRAVVAPADRAERLLVVGLLAGNLVRDQLATLALPEAPPSEPATPATNVLPSAPPTRAATEPPPALASPPASSSASADLVRSARTPTPISEWTLAAAVGPALSFYKLIASPGGYVPDSGDSFTFAAKLEAHRHFGPWFAGAAVDVGPRPGMLVGGALLAGRQWIAGPTRIEASLGAGAEAFAVREYFVFGSSSLIPSDGPNYTETVRPEIYARPSVAVAVPVSRYLDAFASVDGRLASTTRPGAVSMLGALGLRVRLP